MITNGDHIRSMTDEQLAEYMAGFDEGSEPWDVAIREWLAWLKSEYKEAI